MTDRQRLPSRGGSPVNDHDHPSRPADEIALEHMPEKADSTSLASPPADPPPDSMGSSPPYYLPNSAREMFLAYPPPLALGEEEKQRMKFEKKGQPSELEEGESGEEEGGKEDVENSRNSRRAALNRRQTRLYRTLVWVQFSLNVFSCIFILAILILVAIILVMLQRTIDRADHAIRDNPVSQMYSKLKSAVNKINIS